MTSISLDGLNIALCQFEFVLRGEMAERMEVHTFVSCRVTKDLQALSDDAALHRISVFKVNHKIVVMVIRSKELL